MTNIINLHTDPKTGLKYHKKTCSVCGKEFNTFYGHALYCSLECRMKVNRERSSHRAKMLELTNRKNVEHMKMQCEVCGYNKFTKIMWENGEKMYLCPNHFLEKKLEIG